MRKRIIRLAQRVGGGFLCYLGLCWGAPALIILVVFGVLWLDGSLAQRGFKTGPLWEYLAFSALCFYLGWRCLRASGWRARPLREQVRDVVLGMTEPISVFFATKTARMIHEFGVPLAPEQLEIVNAWPDARDLSWLDRLENLLNMRDEAFQWSRRGPKIEIRATSASNRLFRFVGRIETDDGTAILRGQVCKHPLVQLWIGFFFLWASCGLAMGFWILFQQPGVESALASVIMGIFVFALFSLLKRLLGAMIHRREASFAAALRAELSAPVEMAPRASWRAFF